MTIKLRNFQYYALSLVSYQKNTCTFYQKNTCTFYQKNTCTFYEQCRVLFMNSVVYFLWTVFILLSHLYKSKEDSCRPKYTFKFFHSVRIETIHKSSKEAVAKMFFPSVYVIDATCFDDCFLFHDNYKALFL